MEARKTRQNLNAYLFLLPALLIFGVFFIYPNIEILYLSLFKWAGVSPNKVFIGLINYIDMVQDREFWISLVHTLVIAGQSIVIQIPIALVLAILLNRRMIGSGIYSTVIFLPMVVSLVSVGIIWTWIYDPEFGVLNTILAAMGLESWQMAWLGNVKTAFISVLIVINWIYIGLYTIILMAGLKGISPEIFDAAKVDGFNEFMITTKIRVPLLKEVIGVIIIMCISGSFKSFDLIWVMTGGGPVNSTEIVTTYLYRMAFRRMQSGYASAIGVMIFLICLLLILFQLRMMRINPEEQAE